MDMMGMVWDIQGLGHDGVLYFLFFIFLPLLCFHFTCFLCIIFFSSSLCLFLETLERHLKGAILYLNGNLSFNPMSIISYTLKSRTVLYCSCVKYQIA